MNWITTKDIRGNCKKQRVDVLTFELRVALFCSTSMTVNCESCFAPVKGKNGSLQYAAVLNSAAEKEVYHIVVYQVKYNPKRLVRDLLFAVKGSKK